MNRFIPYGLCLTKLNSKFSGIVLNSSRYSTSKTIENVSFNFKINKFNDIHISAKDLINFGEETKSDLDVFERTLKSFSIF